MLATTPRLDVLAIGQCASDTLCLVPHLPHADTKLEVGAFVRAPGGPAATAAATVQRLGGRAAFLGRLGDDALGDHALAQLAAQGIDITHCVRTPGAASHQAVVLACPSDGTRTIVWTRGSAGLARPDDVPRDAVLAAKGLLLDSLHLEAGAHAAAIARRAKRPVFLDGGTARDGVLAVLKRTDVCFATRAFAFDLTGARTIAAALPKLARLGPRVVGVTLGAEGAIAYDAAARETLVSSGFAVDVVDTTGAGDAFHGALAFALLRGARLDIACAFANAVAALACTALGAQAGLPTRAQALALVRAQRPALRLPAALTRDAG